ncbi:MAG: hypothetical protein CM1200mP13_16990 [Candidatus Pelagibacterales bacterium]|nr:MAG: hypothetical protein CM1200mP13_16990 [Pelagibacterales bacterium]
MREKKLFPNFFIARLNLTLMKNVKFLQVSMRKEKSTLKSYCNTIETPDGGSHENAFKNSLLKSIKLFGQKNHVSKITNINANDLFDYSDSFISIFINSPSFEGQTKKRIAKARYPKKIRTRDTTTFFVMA